MTIRLAHRIGILAVALAFSMGTALNAHAAAPIAPARQAHADISEIESATNEDVPMRRRSQHDVDASGVRWSQLSPGQRQVLAPLHQQWNRMPARRQQHLAMRAQDWAQLPLQRRAMVSARIGRWAGMDRQQRQQAMRGADRFRDLPETDRKRLMETWQRFQTLPPQQRRELMQRWREQRKKSRPARQ